MSLYKRAGIWWIDLRHRGRRVRRSTGAADKQAAKRQHDELRARLWQEKQTGKQFSDALVAWIKARPRSQNDLNAVRLIRAEYHDRPLVDVTAASIEQTLGDRSPGTYNRLLAVVRAALNLAKRAEWIEQIPHLPRRKEPPPPTRFLTGDEWGKLRAELPEHLQDMADFSIATGVRWSNVALLDWSQVSIGRKLAWVNAADAKGGKSIPIPLSRDAIAVLQRRKPDDTGFVFTYHGQPILSPKTAWLAAVKRAGLDGFRWHDLRHTWASWHAMNGTPIDALQKLGGWQTRAMVDRYAHLSPGYLAQFADNANPAKSGHKNGHSKGKTA